MEMMNIEDLCTFGKKSHKRSYCYYHSQLYIEKQKSSHLGEKNGRWKGGISRNYNKNYIRMLDKDGFFVDGPHKGNKRGFWNTNKKGTYQKGQWQNKEHPRGTLGKHIWANRVHPMKGKESPNKGKHIWNDRGHPTLGKHIWKNKKHPKGMLGKKQSNKWLELRKNLVLPFKDTKIEIKIQLFLKELGIEFFTHQYIKNIEHSYQCDILIPSMNLVIECDGNYWHKYPIGLEKDHIRTKELIEKGFKVLRLWENEINIMTIEDFNLRLNKRMEE